MDVYNVGSLSFNVLMKLGCLFATARFAAAPAGKQGFAQAVYVVFHFVLD
jgi:hypothetical protein